MRNAWAFLIVGLVACGKGGGGGGGGGAEGGHFGAWKPDDTKAALQGAWVGPSPGNSIEKAAYEISGDTVKVFEDDKEKSYKLAVEVPCKIGLAEPDGTTTYFGFILKDGKALWGGGDAGMRSGDHGVFCAGFSTWAVEKDKCFERDMSKRWGTDKKCGIRKGASGEEFFFTSMMDKEEANALDGDLMWEFKDSPAQKVADFAAAKAALAK